MQLAIKTNLNYNLQKLIAGGAINCVNKVVHRITKFSMPRTQATYSADAASLADRIHSTVVVPSAQ
jgi:hypothetical protein